MEHEHGNGLEADVAGQKIKATGLVVIMLVLTCMLAGLMLYGFTMLQSQDERMQRQHEAIVRGINDVFIAIAVPEEKKHELPGFMKKRLKEKFENKAEELTDKKQ